MTELVEGRIERCRSSSPIAARAGSWNDSMDSPTSELMPCQEQACKRLSVTSVERGLLAIYAKNCQLTRFLVRNMM